jgi:hypothetical protein
MKSEAASRFILFQKTVFGTCRKPTAAGGMKQLLLKI